ncbi:hypothetical protein DdX_22446 [Ditylenchus destructor]|uniref:GST C-terminal domain-containing protein n=1 Tax=Ditylenchus destructor TaxID=166010 RepID=A0AAD4MHY9_9BILA|nr:hypothetical protein DdX_22446 [Ditylenchus destructor]
MFTLRKTYYRYYNKEDDKWYLIKYDMKKLELDAAKRKQRDDDVKTKKVLMRDYRYLPIKYKHFVHKPDVVLNTWNGNRDDLWQRIVNGRSEIYDFDKVLFDALEVAVAQLKKTKAALQAKNPKAKFYLFGDKPTPADASVFAELAIFFEVQKDLTNKRLKDYFEEAKTKPTSPHHVLWEFVQQVKEHDFMRKEDDSIHRGGRSLTLSSSTWDSLKSEPWPLNWDWDLEPTALPDKYEGPYQLKHKEFPLLEDEEFIKNDDIEQQEEAEDEEQKDMDDKDLEIKDGKLLGDGKQASSNGDDDKEEESNNWIKGYADDYTKEEIDNFVPLTVLEAWDKLYDKRILYEAPEEPGNIFHHYSKMYRYLAQKFLMLTGLKQNEKLIDVQIPVDYDLEHLEDSLVIHINKIIFGDKGGSDPGAKPGQGGKAAVAAKQAAQMAGNIAKKVDDKLLGIADWMKEENRSLKKKGPPVGRTLLHLMAAHACDGQVLEEQALEVCKDQEGGGVRQSILKWAGRKFENRSWNKSKNMGKKLSGAADDRLTKEQEDSITVQLCLKEVKAHLIDIKTKEVHESKEKTELKEVSQKVLECGDMHRALAYGLLGELLNNGEFKNNEKKKDKFWSFLRRKSMPDKSKANERDTFLNDLKKVVEEKLKVEENKTDPKRDNTLGEDVKAIIEKMTENYKRIVVDPDYSPEEVKAFEPIEHSSKPKLVHVDEKDATHKVFKVDEVVMFYYPEVMQYLVLELPKLAGLTLAKELRLTQRPDRLYIQNSGWWRRHIGGKKFKKIEAKRERVDDDPKLEAMKTALKAEIKKAEEKTKKKEPIVMAMLHQMAAYLCENEDENGDACGDKHRKSATEHLKGVP